MPSRPSAVRMLSPRSIGSRTGLLEGAEPGALLYHVGQLVRWAWRHPRKSVPLGLLLWIGAKAGLGAVVVVLILGGVCLTAWLALGHGSASGAAASMRLAIWGAWRGREIQAQWPKAMRAAKLRDPDSSSQTPRLYWLKATGDGKMTAYVSPGKIGVDIDDMAARARKIAGMVDALQVVITPTSPGKGRVDFMFKDPLEADLSFADMPPASKRGEVVYGVRQDGSPATLVYGQSVLIGGLTRRGKSNVVKAMVGDLQRQEVPAEVYASDPKGGIGMSEYGQVFRDGGGSGSVKVAGYVDNVADTTKLVNAVDARMKERQGRMRAAGISELTVATAEYPAIILVLDEVVALKALLDKGANSVLGQILYMGAASLVVVWVNSQAGQMDVLGPVRRFIPQRICFATDAAQNTNAVLGDYAEENLDARCSRISVAGVGYSRAEHDQRPTIFRAAKVTRTEARMIASGRLTSKVVHRHQQMLDERRRVAKPLPGARALAKLTGKKVPFDGPTDVYIWRFLDPASATGFEPGTCGYVGVAGNVMKRTDQHDADRRVFLSGNCSREVIPCDTRAEALALEEKLIHDLKPIYNVQHNQANPRRIRDKVL